MKPAAAATKGKGSVFCFFHSLNVPSNADGVKSLLLLSNGAVNEKVGSQRDERKRKLILGKRKVED